MGVWHFIQPTATINYSLNPSFEANVTDDWGVVPGGARAQSSAYSKWGAYSCELTANAVGDSYMQAATGVSVPDNGTVTVSAWVYRPTAIASIVLVRDTTNAANRTTTAATLTGEWEYITATWTNTTGAPATCAIRITNGAADGASVLYIDGAQIELQIQATTYCDGDQPGCEWLAAEHFGISQRSAVSRAGGIVVDFADRYFHIESMIGPGMSPITLNVDSYAILPGGELNSQKTDVRAFTLAGWVQGTSLSNLHARRQQLIEDLAPNSMPADQPITLRYTGASVTKEIEAYYETGLEGRIRADFECLEQAFALRFLATDPNFYEIGESADILDSIDTALSLRCSAGRLRATGQWDALGPPNIAGTYNAIYAIEVAADRVVWWGGDFLNFNNLGAPAADYIIRYIPSTATWAVVGGAFTFNGIVHDIKEAPNGDIYVCGAFNDGAGNRDNIAYWDGAAWQAVGVPIQAATVMTAIYGMAFDSSGNLYVVGNFQNLASAVGSNLDYVAMWDGTNWNAVGIPLAGAAAITDVTDVAIDSNDNIYIGGNFTTFANVAGADYIAMWDGAAWNLVVQLNNIVTALVVDNQDQLFLSGSFTNAGGEANADYIARWNRQSMSALSTGLDAAADMLDIGPDGLLYAVGAFTTAGGLTVNGLARWNGASWTSSDTQGGGWAGPDHPTAIALDIADPVIPVNYNQWLGINGTSAFDYAGLVTVANDGTEEGYPRIRIGRTGGTTAILYSVRNETTGKELLFAYSLLDGEILTIDLAPTRKSIVSNFWGPRQDAILPNCDFGEWALMPGNNDVSCYVFRVGPPVVIAEIIWRDSYWSAD